MDLQWDTEFGSTRAGAARKEAIVQLRTQKDHEALKNVLKLANFYGMSKEGALTYAESIIDVLLDMVHESSFEHLPTFLEDVLILKTKMSPIIELYVDDNALLAHLFYLLERVNFLENKIQSRLDSGEVVGCSDESSGCSDSEKDSGSCSSSSSGKLPGEEDRENPRDFESSIVVASEAEMEIDSNETFTCNICYTPDIPKKDAFRYSKCGHFYCKECITEYHTTNIKQSKITIPCPDPSCEEFAWPDDIRKSVDAETVTKFERLTLVSYIKLEPNAFWCPHPGCENAILAEPGDTHILCNLCYGPVCAKCQCIYHRTSTCEEYQASLAPEDKRTRKWKKKHGVKACPHCGTETIRSSGCSHMICGNCKRSWSWYGSDPEPFDRLTGLEKVAFFYPEIIVKEVMGSREVKEKFKEDRRAAAVEYVPYFALWTAVGVPALAVAGPPALLMRGSRKLRESLNNKKMKKQQQKQQLEEDEVQSTTAA